MPNVSVIIPSYNSANYLPETIESVLVQTYRDYEIILVDDGSTDETDQVIAKYRSHLNVIQQENKGLSAARNIGIKNALGEYLVFLDADDLILPNKLEDQVPFLDQHPGVDIVYSDGYLFKVLPNGTEERVLFSKASLLDRTLGAPEQNVSVLLTRNAFPIHAALVRRKAAVEDGGFDEADELMALEDWEFWYRLAWGHHFAYLNKCVCLYRVCETGISKSSTGMLRASIYLERKISASEDFMQLSGAIQSRFYFSLGVLALKFNDSGLGHQRFMRALDCSPFNLVALFAYSLTFLDERTALRGFRILRYVLKTRGRLRL